MIKNNVITSVYRACDNIINVLDQQIYPRKEAIILTREEIQILLDEIEKNKCTINYFMGMLKGEYSTSASEKITKKTRIKQLCLSLCDELDI